MNSQASRLCSLTSRMFRRNWRSVKRSNIIRTIRLGRIIMRGRVRIIIMATIVTTWVKGVPCWDRQIEVRNSSSNSRLIIMCRGVRSKRRRMVRGIRSRREGKCSRRGSRSHLRRGRCGIRMRRLRQHLWVIDLQIDSFRCNMLMIRAKVAAATTSTAPLHLTSKTIITPSKIVSPKICRTSTSLGSTGCRRRQIRTTEVVVALLFNKKLEVRWHRNRWSSCNRDIKPRSQMCMLMRPSSSSLSSNSSTRTEKGTNRHRRTAIRVFPRWILHKNRQEISSQVSRRELPIVSLFRGLPGLSGRIICHRAPAWIERPKAIRLLVVLVVTPIITILWSNSKGTHKCRIMVGGARPTSMLDSRCKGRVSSRRWQLAMFIARYNSRQGRDSLVRIFVRHRLMVKVSKCKATMLSKVLDQWSELISG